MSNYYKKLTSNLYYTKKASSSSFTILAVITLAIISSAIEVDIFVPSMPSIQKYFATTESMVQMLLTINFAGLATSSLLYGPLSDSYGRRKVMLVGMFIFTVGALGCVLTNSLGWLVFWRFWQGFGCSVAFVVPGAMIFDIFTKEKAAGMLGMLNSAITCAMAGAPLLGSYLYLKYDWHANFLLVAIVSLITWFITLFFCYETLDQQKKKPFNLKSISRDYKLLLTNRSALLLSLVICLIITGELVYVANLSLIFINYLDVSEYHFPYYQGAVLVMFAIASLFCNKVISILGVNNTRKYGSICSFTGALLLLLSALFYSTPLAITISMCIYTIGFALIIGIIYGDYMGIFPDIKGAASALSNAQRMILLSIFIAISGMFFNGTMIPVAIIVFAFSLVSTVIILK